MPQHGPEFLEKFRELQSTHDALLDAVARRYGIGRNDLRCLDILRREGPMPPRTLAERAHLSAAAITKVTDRLVETGFAARVHDQSDRRSHRLVVTEQLGELRHGVWGPIWRDALDVLDSLGADDLERFGYVVSQLTDVTRRHVDRLAQARDG